MGTTPNAAVITRLGYDSTDLKSGLAQAKQDVAKYKEEALRIDAELRRAKLQNLTEYSREKRRQVEDELAQQLKLIRSQTGSLAHVRGAQKQAGIERLNELKAEYAEMKRNLGLFDEQRKKVFDLQKAQVEASIAVKRSQLAAGLFTQAGPSQTQQITDALSQGLGRISPALAQVVSQLSALKPAAAEGSAGIAGLGGTAMVAVGIFGALAAAASGATIAISKGALEAGRWADQLEELSQRTGIPVQQLQGLEFVGKATNLTLDDLVTGTRGLSKAMVEGNPAFEKFGIRTREANGELREVLPVLLDLADVFKSLPAGPEKIALAVELLGRSGQALIPTLTKGKQSLQELFVTAERFSPNIKELAAAFDEYEIATAKSDAATLQIKAQFSGLISLFAAAKTGLAEYLRLLAQSRAAGFSAVDPFGGPLAIRLRERFGDPGAPAPIAGRTPSAQGIPSGIPGAPPRKESQAVLDERKKLEAQRAEMSRKILSETNQLLAAQKELAKLKDEEFKVSDAKRVENLEQQRKLEKEISDILAARTTRQAAEQKSLQGSLKEAQAREIELTAEEEKALADAARKTAQSEADSLRIMRERLAVVEDERRAVEFRKEIFRAQATNEALSTERRRDAEKNLNDEIEKRVKLIKEQADLEKGIADAMQKIASEALAGKPTRQAPPLMMQAPQPRSFRDFQSELAGLRVQEALGVNVLNQELEIRRALNASLIEQIRLRMASGVATDKERQELEKLLGELKQNREEISRGSSAAFKQSTFGQFLEGMQKISDIVGKFAPSLSKGLGQLFAIFEVFKALGDQLRLLGGGTMQGGQVVGGSAFAGLQGIFTGRGPRVQVGTDVFGAPKVSGTTLTSGQRMQAAMMLIAGISGGISQWRQGGTANRALGGAMAGGTIGMLAGPEGAIIGAIIGAAIGAISSTTNKGVGTLAGWALGGPIGGFFGFRAASRRAETKRIAETIKAELKSITDAFASGSGTLNATIQGLEKERADAITRLTGKKGASKPLKEITDAIDKELLTLKRQQKDILEAFNLKVALAGVPENARETAQSISELAAVLKEAADAGASADQQIKYLNATLDDLKVKLGRDLRSDEQETIDLLMQEIDLQKQREGIIKDAADAELAVKQKLGISRILTPSQQAAQEIKAIRDARDEKLASLDEEAARLKAQVEGRAELFGFTSDELDLQGQRATLLERQLELERSITQEVIARIREQQNIFRQLAAGLIPSLPAGILPPGYAFPAGTSYAINNPTIAIYFTNPPTDPDQAAEMIRVGVSRVAARKVTGFAS
jgi:hypothetical protein